ncbi:PqqD family protein [Kitasatospora sp. NPDC002227]|uniref:PqqD family protein n=1 Tax=Kitasatospora sp. NPDC002227 TaxID=3154773 RepID=UPI0033316873
MRYEISEDVVWTPGFDEVRLYDSESGEFQTLNSTAAQIWTLLADGKDVEGIVAELGAEHTDGSPEALDMIGSDIRGFLAELAARGVLVAETAASAS